MIDKNLSIEIAASEAADSHVPDTFRRITENSELCRYLSNGTRLRIVSLLMQGEQSVLSLEKLLGVPQSTISCHLASMREAELIGYRQSGKKHVHFLTEKGMQEMAELRSMLQMFATGEPTKPGDSTDL